MCKHNKFDAKSLTLLRYLHLSHKDEKFILKITHSSSIFTRHILIGVFWSSHLEALTAFEKLSPARISTFVIFSWYKYKKKFFSWIPKRDVTNLMHRFATEVNMRCPFTFDHECTSHPETASRFQEYSAFCLINWLMNPTQHLRSIRE